MDNYFKALVTTFLIVFATPTWAANDVAQARKDLTAMGLSYNDEGQFFKAIAAKDEIAINLFVAAKGIDLSATPKAGGKTAIGVAYDTKDAKILKKLLTAGALPSTQDVAKAVKNKDELAFMTMTSTSGLRKGTISADIVTDALVTKLFTKDSFRQFVDRLDVETLRNSVNSDVLTVSMWLYRDVTLVEALLQKLGDQEARNLINKPDVADQNWKGHRILAWATAVQSPQFNIIPVLVKHGADVNAVDPVLVLPNQNSRWHKKPGTALMRATQVANPHAVEALLRAGADPNIVVVQEDGGMVFVGVNKKTALSIAENLKSETTRGFDQRRAEVVRLLTAAGAKGPSDVDNAKGEKPGAQVRRELAPGRS